jgi:3-isopropylmalate/(R)-2-methylmalate dehydratase small subunit
MTRGAGAERLHTVGRAWVLGDFVEVNDLCRTQFFTRPVDELTTHLLEHTWPQFASTMQPGDVLVGGRGFGVGGGHDHAHTALRAAGTGGIVATSFGWQFYRHAVDHALPLLVVADREAVAHGDELDVDFVSGEIINRTKQVELHGVPMPGIALDIVREGGLVNHIRARLQLPLTEPLV